MNLKKARTNKKLTQTQLGKKAKLSQTQISHLEQGKHSPQASTRNRLEKVLKRPITFIGDPEPISKENGAYLFDLIKILPVIVPLFIFNLSPGESKRALKNFSKFLSSYKKEDRFQICRCLDLGVKQLPGILDQIESFERNNRIKNNKINRNQKGGSK